MTDQIKKIVCLVAGNSGGHIIPALTYAQRMVEKGEAQAIVFFSTTNSLDTTIIQNTSITLIHIALTIEPVPHLKPWRYPICIYRLIYAFLISFYYMRLHKPKNIVSFGGLVSIPVCLAGYINRIPFDIYTLDALPGAAIGALASRARTIYVCFRKAYLSLSHHKPVLSSYPIKFNQSHISKSKKGIYSSLTFNDTHPTLLILGGSQGSQSINMLITQALTYLVQHISNIQIIHQTGPHGTDELKQWYRDHNILAHVFNFAHDLSPYYNIADVAICRAGAGTLFELLFFKIPTITIPLKTVSTDHQIENAKAFTDSYGPLFEYLMQEEVEKHPARLAERIADKLKYCRNGIECHYISPPTFLFEISNKTV